MTTLRACIALSVLLLAAMPLQAHEFWIGPVTPALTVGDTARLTLHVGEFFEGEMLGFTASQTAAFRQYSAAGSKDLRALMPLRAVLPAFTLPVTTAGTHLVTFDSQPNTITLSADRFHAYLHDEGLDFIKTQRETSGMAEKPGRERYRRFVKTLLRVSAAPNMVEQSSLATPDMTYATLVGQRLEILPMTDPLALTPGDALSVRVIFEGKPLQGALLKAWHKQGNQTLTIRARTSADGIASFNLPYNGAWMISVVHMVPAIGTKEFDWDSLWGNLTFALPTINSRSGTRP